MKIFFDTEFTGLHKNTTLMSIGLISENGYKFYAQLTDYDETQINDWLKENVLSKFWTAEKGLEEMNSIDQLTFCIGTKEQVKNMLMVWPPMNETNVEMWSDCLAYDWVLFNDLFGTAFDIPKNVYYIPFDICTMFKIKMVDPDVNREQFAFKQETPLQSPDKHNALWDAQIIKKCYENLSVI